MLSRRFNKKRVQHTEEERKSTIVDSQRRTKIIFVGSIIGGFLLYSYYTKRKGVTPVKSDKPKKKDSIENIVPRKPKHVESSKSSIKEEVISKRRKGTKKGIAEISTKSEIAVRKVKQDMKNEIKVINDKNLPDKKEVKALHTGIKKVLNQASDSVEEKITKTILKKKVSKAMKGKITRAKTTAAIQSVVGNPITLEDGDVIEDEDVINVTGEDGDLKYNDEDGNPQEMSGAGKDTEIEWTGDAKKIYDGWLLSREQAKEESKDIIDNKKTSDAEKIDSISALDTSPEHTKEILDKFQKDKMEKVANIKVPVITKETAVKLSKIGKGSNELIKLAHKHAAEEKDIADEIKKINEDLSSVVNNTEKLELRRARRTLHKEKRKLKKKQKKEVKELEKTGLSKKTKEQLKATKTLFKELKSGKGDSGSFIKGAKLSIYAVYLQAKFLVRLDIDIHLFPLLFFKKQRQKLKDDFMKMLAISGSATIENVLASVKALEFAEKFMPE